MRKVLLCALGVLLSASLHASTVNVSGNNVQDVSGVPLYSGQWCFGATCLTVSNGAFSGTVTAGTNTVTVKNGSSVTILSVSGVVIGGTSYSWNNYVVPYSVTFTGNGAPYLACQLSALYTQEDVLPAAAWYCVAQSGQLVWQLAGPPTPAGPGIISGLGVPTLPAVVPTIYIRTDVPQQYNLTGLTGSVSSIWIEQSSGNFNAAGDLSGSGSSQTVIGLENIALPTLAEHTGYLYDNNGVLRLQTPSGTGTVTTTGSPASPDVACFSGATSITNCSGIPNSALENDAISGVPLGSNLYSLSFGTHLTGTSYNGSVGVTIATDAASANTASTIVARDGSGNFAAGTITANLTGTASGNIANSLLTTLGDMIYLNGTTTRLPGPTAGAGTYLLADVTLSSSPVAETWVNANTLSVNYAATAGITTTAVNLQAITQYCVPYQTDSGTTGCMTPVDNAVIVTDASGIPSESTSLPSGITLPATVAQTNQPNYFTQPNTFSDDTVFNFSTSIQSQLATGISGNLGSPQLSFVASYWDGSGEYANWTIQHLIGTGPTPTSTLKFTPPVTLGGTLVVDAPVTFGIQNDTAGALALVGSNTVGGSITLYGDGGSPGSSVISVNTAGTTLNLGSTNAYVTTAGALTVASCTGCGGGGGLSGMTQYGLPVAATASTVTSSVQPSSWTSGHTFVPVWQPSGSALAPTVVDANTLIVSAAGTARNLAGTGVDYAPYQSASGTTDYITAPTTNAHTFVYAWQPNGSAVAPTAFDITSYLTTGTVTSVGWTGGIVSVATQTTTPAFTIAGTSGGHPYFNSATTWASSGAGTTHGLWLAQGAGNADTTTGAGAVGTILAGAGGSSDPNFTATPQLGASGTLGSITMGNATSGLLTIEPATGAITSYTLQLPVAQPTAGNTYLSCTAASPAVCTWAAGGSGLSGMTSGQLGIAGSASTLTSSIAYATANTASTIVERDGSSNINATTFTGNLTGNASGTSANVTGIVAGANGGTGVANTGVTETFAANFTTTGSGAPTLAFPATNPYTYTHPAYTGTLVEETASDTTTSHVLHATATTGVGTFSAIAASDLPAALSSSSSINKVTITAPTTSATLTIADGTTLSSTYSMNVAKTAGVAGAIPWYDTTTSESATALLTQYGVMIGGGASNAPSTIAASVTTTQALFATATAPAFRAIAYTDLPTGTGSNQVVLGGAITAGGPTGGATSIPVITYNAAGQLTTVTTATPTVATVQGGAAGDVLYQSAANTTGFSGAGTTGQTLVSGGTGAPTFSNIWMPQHFAPALCNNTTAGSGFSLPVSNAATPFCRTGTYVQAGYLQFTGGTTSQSAQFQTEVPGDIDTTAVPYIRLNYTQGTDTTNGHVIAMQVQSVCGATTDDIAWPTATAFPTTTPSSGGAANDQYTVTVQLSAANFPAACVGGAIMNFNISTVGTTNTNTTVNLQMVVITWPEKTPGVSEAN